MPWGLAMSLGEGLILAGRYRLISSIGSGAMGSVWRANDDRLGREVAVKTVLLPPGLTTAERDVLYERTLREARSAARLSHPGIVTVHDVFEENGRPCIVMELLHARSLHDVIDDEGRLPPVLVAAIGAKMLAALQAAHAAGILHRDVKPANVMLVLGESGKPTADARVVITDFGIAAVEGETALTRTGMVMGSPSYIAPERVRGEWAGPASDLWALGATLYTATEGRPPYVRDTAMDTLMAVRNDEPDPPRHAGPLTPVLRGLLTKDVPLRMPAGQAAEGLALVLRQAQSPPSPEPPSSQPPSPQPPSPEPRAEPAPPRTGRWKIPVLAGLALVTVTAAGFLLFRSGSGGETGGNTAATSAPAGYQRADGPGGTALSVPRGWSRHALRSTSVRWTEPASGAYLQLETTRWGVSDPAAHWRRFRREPARRSAFPALRVLHQSGDFSARGWTTADVEFTSTLGTHRRVHGYGRAFVANGHQYTLLVVAPAEQWSSRHTAALTTAFNAFRPPGS